MRILRKLLSPFKRAFLFVRDKVRAYREYRKRKKELDKIDPFDKMYPLMTLLFFL